MKKALFILLHALIIPLVYSQSPNNTVQISGDLTVTGISEHTFVHTSYYNLQGNRRVGANGLIFTNGNEAFIFDSPWTDEQTEKLVTWIRDSLKAKIKGFIPNHWHIDCMGGLASIKQHNIKSYANRMTIDIARENGLPLPDSGFIDSLVIKAGDETINCYYLGPAHSMDNIAVWIPSEKILFAGCVIKSMESGNLGNTSDGDPATYPETLDELLEMFSEAEIVIPGHGNFGGPELIEHTKDLATQ